MTLRSIVLIAAMVMPRWSHGQAADGAVAPQTPEITLQTKATTAQLERWLHSGEPRLIAWGATLARAHGDAAALADAEKILKDWPRDPHTRDLPDGREQHEAMATLLDALIQLKMPVRRDTVLLLEEKFPSETVLLAMNATEDERSSILSYWLSSAGFVLPGMRATRSEASHQRIAAMFEAKNPRPGFAVSLLRDAEEHVQISIGREGVKPIGYDRFSNDFPCGSMSYGSYVKEPVMPGWPVVYEYHLEAEPMSGHSNGVAPAGIVVEAGGTRITWWRAGPDDWPGSCGVWPLSAETRHGLLAEMLGEPESALPWPVRLSRTILWQDEQQAQAEIGKIVAGESAKQRQTLLDLMAKGLILPDEIKDAMPAILLDIQYGPTVPAH